MKHATFLVAFGLMQTAAFLVLFALGASQHVQGEPYWKLTTLVGTLGALALYSGIGIGAYRMGGR